MIEQQIGRWKISHDPVLTRHCYSQMRFGAGCECSSCRNFILVVSQGDLFELHDLADALGIDASKPAELYYYDRESTDLYLTGGWYHFVGELHQVAESASFRDKKGMLHFEQRTPRFEVGVGDKVSLVDSAFDGYPILQFEFLTRVPWMLSEPPPDELPSK